MDNVRVGNLDKYHIIELDTEKGWCKIAVFVAVQLLENALAKS